MSHLAILRVLRIDRVPLVGCTPGLHFDAGTWTHMYDMGSCQSSWPHCRVHWGHWYVDKFIPGS